MKQHVQKHKKCKRLKKNIAWKKLEDSNINTTMNRMQEIEDTKMIGTTERNKWKQIRLEPNKETKSTDRKCVTVVFGTVEADISKIITDINEKQRK